MRKFLEIPFHKTEFKDFYGKNGGAKTAITSISNFFVRQKEIEVIWQNLYLQLGQKRLKIYLIQKKMENDIFVVLW